MIHRFEYDGVHLDGRDYYVRGEAEVEEVDDTISSEAGNSWVHQKLKSYRVGEIWVDYLEDTIAECEIPNIPDCIMEYVRGKLEDFEFC